MEQTSHVIVNNLFKGMEELKLTRHEPIALIQRTTRLTQHSIRSIEGFRER